VTPPRKRRPEPEPEPEPEKKHFIVSKALARIQCACGWVWRNDFLKGKSDERLEEEAESRYCDHLIAAEGGAT
jgi:hypothetical protein